MSELLALDGIIGVSTPKELEATMVAQQLVAGIEFQHFAVKKKRKETMLSIISKCIFTILFLIEYHGNAEETFLFASISE